MKRRRSQRLQARKRPRLAGDLPHEIWDDILSRVGKETLLAAALCRKDHYLHTVAVRRLREEKVALVEDALRQAGFVWGRQNLPIEAQHLNERLVDSVGTERLPKVACEVLRRYIVFFRCHPAGLDRNGHWQVQGNAIGHPPFLEITFRPSDPSTGVHPYEVLVKQYHDRGGYCFGDCLKKLFRALRFRVTVSCQRHDRSWTSDISDSDYLHC